LSKTLKRDKLFILENVRSIRPVNGLSTKFYEEILGKKAKYDISSDISLKEDMFK